VRISVPVSPVSRFIIVMGLLQGEIQQSSADTKG
jgi:hypothetical protein